MKGSIFRWTAMACLLVGCGGANSVSQDEARETDHLHSDRGGIGVTSQAVDGSVTIDARRSLAVTETAIVSQLTLAAVLDQLAAQSGVAGMTGLQLFKQLWDTQNVSPGQTAGPHCTDNGSTVNSFSYDCRPSEGDQAGSSAASITQYSAVGLFNRFDLAPSAGADCGEYRVVFAKTSGGGRSFVIFEAVLPNPTPSLGLTGCRPVQQLWADLTSNDDVSSRATALHDFYFNGLPGFLPVIHLDNYGNTGLDRATGQVRVNEFIGHPWMLREFKLQKLSASSLHFVPVTDKMNPFGDLFRPGSTHPLAAEFQGTFFPSQVAALAVNDINAFNYSVPDKFNIGQSDAQSGGVVDEYVSRFAGPGALRTSIQAQLTALGSTLTPDNIVARAEALSCGGCHERSNGASLGGGLTWPGSGDFVHATELLESGPDGQRFHLSNALTSTFLPHRKAVMEAFLGAGAPTTDSSFSYTAANTTSATVGTTNQSVTLQPGDDIVVGTCGVPGASGVGDTYLRLFDPLGKQVSFNDDAAGPCGLLSTLTYHVPPSSGGTYQIRAGCYSSNGCSGTVAHTVTPGPSSYSFSYNASNTSFATVYTTDQWVILQAGETLRVGTCGVDGASGVGDTYLRLYNPLGNQVMENDDGSSYCGLLSTLTYLVPPSGGGTYQIRAGCYAARSCGGTVAYTK